MKPTDPVPPLPRLQVGDRVVVVDAKTRSQLARFDGRRGRVLDGRPLRFLAAGDWRPVPIDSPRFRGDRRAVIVEHLA